MAISSNDILSSVPSTALLDELEERLVRVDDEGELGKALDLLERLFLLRPWNEPLLKETAAFIEKHK